MRRLFAVPGIRRMMCVFAALVMICGCMVSFASAEGTELALEGYIRGAFTMDSLFAAAESALEDGMEAKQVVQEMIALADSEDALEFLCIHHHMVAGRYHNVSLGVARLDAP